MEIRAEVCYLKSVIFSDCFCRFCHGSCASFFIPKLRSKKLKATFQSCAACVPIETDLTQVRLDCPDREEKVIYRTVMRVKRCACRNIELDDDEDDEV